MEWLRMAVGSLVTPRVSHMVPGGPTGGAWLVPLEAQGICSL